MTRPFVAATWAAITVTALVLATSTAGAHVEVIEADPADGDTVGSGIDELSLTLSALDPSGPLTVEVVDEDGVGVTTGEPDVSERDSVVTVPVDSLEPGTYRVEWSALSDDGDGVTGGSYTFDVEDSALGIGIWAVWALALGIPAAIFLRPGRKREGDESPT